MQLRGVWSGKQCPRARDKSADIGSFYADHRRDLSLVLIRAQVLIKERSHIGIRTEIEVRYDVLWQDRIFYPLLTKFLSLISVAHGNIVNNQDNNQWYKDGVKLIQDNLKVKPNTNTAKNAILFLGDGMGITTITAARFLDGQMKGQSGEENVLSWEEFPWSAMAKPYAVDQQGPDSASSATAFLCGVKTDQGK